MWAVRRVIELAFGRAGEADLVDRLRVSPRHLDGRGVAQRGGRRARDVHAGDDSFRIGNQREIVGAALGPVAVLPEFQRAGIGRALIRDGMDEVQRRGDPFVIVLGHPILLPALRLRAGRITLRSAVQVGRAGRLLHDPHLRRRHDARCQRRAWGRARQLPAGVRRRLTPSVCDAWEETARSGGRDTSAASAR